MDLPYIDFGLVYCQFKGNQDKIMLNSQQYIEIGMGKTGWMVIDLCFFMYF